MKEHSVISHWEFELELQWIFQEKNDFKTETIIAILTK